VSLFWRLLTLLALAAIGALAWHLMSADPGYVLVIWRGYSLETTVVVAVAAGLLGWLLLRSVVWVLRLPFHAWRRRSRKLARERLAGGLLALHEGRWAKAEKLLTRAASDPLHRQPALLAALHAAQARGDADNASALRARLGEDGDAALLALLDADALLREGRADAACDALAKVGPGDAPRALELKMRALGECGRATDALGLLPALRQSQVLEGAALEAFESELQASALRQAPDAGELALRWETASRAQRARAEVVAAYAERAATLGLEDQAAAAIEHALKKQWSEALARRYGQLARGQRGSPLKAAEHWLKSHPNSPCLLLALGRLCREEGLWGKAEDYLHRALAQAASGPDLATIRSTAWASTVAAGLPGSSPQGTDVQAWEELGHAYAAQRDDARARHAYANALRAGRGESALPMPGRGLREVIQDEAVAEERSPMGVPRLPGAG
jgi:HemY protein